MKAWLVGTKDKFCKIVVFAETGGQAKAWAQYTDEFADAKFFDLEVRRLPDADKYYKEGKHEMDWNNPNDRLVLVKEFGFYCEYSTEADCEDCVAKLYCDRYKDLGESK